MPVLVAYSCGDEFCVMKTPSATHRIAAPKPMTADAASTSGALAVASDAM
jgi:hypothetical protein